MSCCTWDAYFFTAVGFSTAWLHTAGRPGSHFTLTPCSHSEILISPVRVRPDLPADADTQPGFRTASRAILDLQTPTRCGDGPCLTHGIQCMDFAQTLPANLWDVKTQSWSCLQAATAKSPTVGQPGTKKWPHPYSKMS